MAQQADGTVYINTAIDTDGFKAGGKEIEAAVRRMSKTVSGIGETARIALRKQTDAFVKQNQAYAQQEQKVESLRKKLEELSNQKVATEEFKEIGKQIDNDTAKLNRLIQAQEEFIELGGNTDSKTYQKRRMQIEELRMSIEYAKGEQDELLSSGGAYQAVDTSGVSDKLLAEGQRLQQMNNALGTSYQSLKAKIESYGGSAENLVGIKQRLISAFSSLMSKVKSTAKGVGSTLASGLKRAASAMLGLHKNTQKSTGSLGSSLKTMLKYSLGIRSLYVLFNKVRSAIKEGFKNLAQYSGTTNASISSLISALTQLKNSFATAFAPILNVVAPYLTAFINMVSRAVTYVGMLIAALTGQKSFVKAVEVQEDYAASLGDVASSAKKAAKQVAKYLSGLDEIRRFEESDADSDTSGNGGGYTSPSASEMFETVEIENSLKDLAEKIKQAWADADFTEIGTMLGEKLRDALENIPWKKIQATAQKVGKSLATLINGAIEVVGLAGRIGKTVGELLNTGILGAQSFVKNLHFDSLGTFVANAMNNAIKTIKWKNIGDLISASLNGIFTATATWSKKFSFSKLANSVKTTINTALGGINWQTAITAINNIASGIANSLNELISPETFEIIGDTLASVVNTVVSGAHTFIGDIKWGQWGEAIARSINRFFTKTDWEMLGLTFGEAALGILKTLNRAVEKISWSEVGYKIAEMLKAIPWADLLKSAAELVGSVFGGLLDFGKGLLDGFGKADWAKFNSEVEKTLQNLSDTNEEIKARIQNAADWKSAGSEYDYAKELSDMYFDLAEKEGLSNEEKEQMKSLAGELVSTIPELEQYYNSETGLIDATRGSVDNLIESMKAKARTEAAQESLKELYSAQIEAKKAMEETKEEVESLTEQYASQKSEMALLEEEHENLLNSVDDLTMSTSEWNQKISDNEARQIALNEEMKITSGELKTANRELISESKNLNDATLEVDKITGYLSDMNEEMSDTSEATKDVGKETGNTTGSFIKSIVQLGLMALGLGSIKSGSEDAEGGLGSLGSAINGLVKDLPKYAKTALTKGKEVGANYPKGIEDGIEKNTGLVADATESMIEDGIISPTETGLDMHSPSKVAEGFGRNYNQGFANGIKNSINLVTASIIALLNSAKNLFPVENSTFKKFGTDYVTNIANGLKQSSGQATSAVQSIKSSMISAMSDISNAMYNAGKSAASSYANGLRSIHIPMPHVTFRTSTTQIGGTVTTSSSSSVSWYKKGGLFSSPSVIGVGEAGQEAVLPLESTRVMSALANSIVSSLSASTLAKVPLMATGTVIPPKATYETHVTSDLSNTVAELKDAIGKIGVSPQQSGNQNNSYNFTAQINRRTLFEEIISEAQLSHGRTGNNPFLLGQGV